MSNNAATHKARFQVKVLSAELLEAIEGSWTDADYAMLLDRMDYGDTSELGGEELHEMCVLSLQDLTLEEAAALLLEHRLGDALRKGQIQNLSHDMREEKQWEHFADMPLHERFFHVGSLLYQAFPGHVPVPDAVDARLEVVASDAEGEELLAGPLHESFLARLIAGGMPDSAMLNRLFDGAVAGTSFPEAESIVWISERETVDPRTARVRVLGSGHWLDPLRDMDAYEATAYPDAPSKR